MDEAVLMYGTRSMTLPDAIFMCVYQTRISYDVRHHEQYQSFASRVARRFPRASVSVCRAWKESKNDDKKRREAKIGRREDFQYRLAFIMRILTVEVALIG